MTSTLRCAYEGIGEDHPKDYPPPKLCANCRKVAYCSRDCQVDDWDYHVFDCPGANISTAHYLMKAIREDLMPTDAQTCDDWGFTRAGPDGNKILGLFQGLRILIPGLRAHDLRIWKKKGVLVQKIKEEFERLDSPYAKGKYYPWFLQNKWVLDTSLPVPPERGTEAVVRRMKAASIAYVGRDMSEEMQSWSERRQECHLACVSALTGSHLAPHSPGWVSFGYCVARDSYEEMQIGTCYKRLFQERKCPFLDFCDAHENASMFALLKKYGVAPEYRHFEHVLGQSTVHESVWDLKEALLSEQTPPRSVLVDYGFVNCRSNEEHARLVDVYKGMLHKPGFDEMDLHAACIKGDILKYADGILKFGAKEKKALAQLMKNPYPLY
ncbi:hypothetical protein CYLTODRAFT_423701 [Cylindrobasidium torrendii FP15055 ss-10]|uniref:MYND-type domain-containing protein n=1 Tax=Cylindrobasidium torrendii FP15055 ss-10 TaxID=1314674 RepID=A0A0D7B6D9_9AGAR|nr:hypothetical protein CYLTODRAFT_423701 [Cylindrobasidium torrendii FP15055 ss-10]